MKYLLANVLNIWNASGIDAVTKHTGATRIRKFGSHSAYGAGSVSYGIHFYLSPHKKIPRADGAARITFGTIIDEENVVRFSERVSRWNARRIWKTCSSKTKNWSSFEALVRMSWKNQSPLVSHPHDLRRTSLLRIVVFCPWPDYRLTLIIIPRPELQLMERTPNHDFQSERRDLDQGNRVTRNHYRIRERSRKLSKWTQSVLDQIAAIH